MRLIVAVIILSVFAASVAGRSLAARSAEDDEEEATSAPPGTRLGDEQQASELERLRAMRESDVNGGNSSSISSSSALIPTRSAEIERAKRLRKQMVREHIETLLNIKGKQLPSVEEVITPSQAASAAAIWKSLDRSTTYPVTLPSASSSPSGQSKQPPPSPSSSVSGVLIEDAAYLYSDYTEKLQSMFPACSPPSRVDKYGLSEPGDGVEHLYFDLKSNPSSYSPRGGYYVQVLKAALKIKFAPQDILEERRDSAAAAGNQIEEYEYEYGEETDGGGGGAVQYPVKVVLSWIKRFKHKSAKLMTPLSWAVVSGPSSRWLELDAVEAVRRWFQKPRRNLGFFITVSDAAGRQLNASDFVRPVNCSYDDSPAFPSIFSDEDVSDDNSTFAGNATSDYEDVSSTSHQRHVFNMHQNPILDVATVEVPEGDSLPRDMHLFMAAAAAAVTTTTTATAAPQVNATEETTSAPAAATTEDPLLQPAMQFPVFHNVHIRHRRPRPEAGPVREQELVALKPDADDFVMLQKLEEIRFGTSSTTTTTTTTTKPPLRRRHWRNRHHLFRPTDQRVVLTHGDLLSSLEQMLEGQEEQVSAERTLLESLVLMAERQEEEEEEGGGGREQEKEDYEK